MAEREGCPIALRVRPEADTPETRTACPRLVVIDHLLDEVRPNGLPDPAYNESLSDLDLSIIARLERGGVAAVVLIETFAGRRTYYAYAPDRLHGERALEDLRRRFLEHRLELSGRDDPDWGLLEEYRRLFPWD